MLYGLIPKGEYLYIVFLFRSSGFWVGPTIQGMISKEFPLDKQPDLLGVLTGLKILNDFIGPLIFGNLFAFSISPAFPGPQMPGLIFFIASAIFLLSCLFAAITFWIFPQNSSSSQGDAPRRDEFTLLAEGQENTQDSGTLLDDAHVQIHGELEEAFELEDLSTNDTDDSPIKINWKKVT